MFTIWIFNVLKASAILSFVRLQLAVQPHVCYPKVVLKVPLVQLRGFGWWMSRQAAD